jgi:hypothetical protein
MARPSGTVFNARTVEISPGGVAAAIVSLHFPLSSAGAATHELNLWIDAIVMRDVNFLALFR